MGATQSVMYIAPALNIKMGLRVRLFTSCAIQILVCLIDTMETLIAQVGHSHSQYKYLHVHDQLINLINVI